MSETVSSPQPGEQTRAKHPTPGIFPIEIKDALVALSLATWVFGRSWFDLLFNANGYFTKIPVTGSETWALVANILWLGVVIWLALRIHHRAENRALLALVDLFILLLLVCPFDFVRAKIFVWTDSQLLAVLRNPLVLALGTVAAILMLWRHRVSVKAVTVLAGITAPLTLFVFGKALLVGAGILKVPAAPTVIAPAFMPVSEKQARVVWIIFDETDYRVTFQQRPKGVTLPEFDRLRQESVFSENAFPPGDGTIVSMPALITGKMLSAVAFQDFDLTLTARGEAAKPWSETSTVFSDAREKGINSAVVGWYHPYGRVLGKDVARCSWYAFPNYETTRATNFTGAFRKQIMALSGPYFVRQLFIDICRNSEKDAEAAASDANCGLVMLHLPPPHGPAVYLPAKNEFTCTGISPVSGYFNNLALADRELGQIRKAVERAGLESKTWYIMSADHSWRKSAGYDGMRDMRVPFLVDPPDSHSGSIYSARFNTVATRGLVGAILRGDVTDKAGVARWLDANAKSQKPITANCVD